jgi:hypothetical protein
MIFKRTPKHKPHYDRKMLACLGNPDPVGMKVYCPTGKETFDDETTEEAPPRRDDVLPIS